MENTVITLLWVWMGVACCVLICNYLSKREKRNGTPGKMPGYRNPPPPPPLESTNVTNKIKGSDLLQLIADTFDVNKNSPIPAIWGKTLSVSRRGLCYVVRILFQLEHITPRQAVWLNNYLEHNKPADAEDGSWPWWYPKEEYHRRREWLQNHIEKLQKEEKENEKK